MIQLISRVLRSQRVKWIEWPVIDKSLVPFVRRRYSRMVRYIDQKDAIAIDKDLMGPYKYSIEQLMELAGQSCAIAFAQSYPLSELSKRDILVCCGPGNNGGDGLVCARHLKYFGYSPVIYYPKQKDNALYGTLLDQALANGVALAENLFSDKSADSEVELLERYAIIVDALMGFSFKPPVREPYVRIIDLLKKTSVPICSIDIPSGWDVENGPPSDGGIQPQMLISLTAPKMCASKFDGKFHYLGGRFVPESLQSKYNLDLPKYAGTDLVVRLR